ncbi:DUF3887 domain-containing protein [Chloroflexota bacterium]
MISSKKPIRLLGIITIIVLVIALSACAEKPEPEYASSITEGILQASKTGNYAQYSEHFDEAMKNAMPESVFNQTNLAIKAKVGDYTSKEFWKVETQGQYTAVYYKAKFKQEPGDVIVKIVFQDIAGKIYVSGLWFDSPNLRK